MLSLSLILLLLFLFLGLAQIFSRVCSLRSYMDNFAALFLGVFSSPSPLLFTLQRFLLVPIQLFCTFLTDYTGAQRTLL